MRSDSGPIDYEEGRIHFGRTIGGRPGNPAVTAELDIWRRLSLAGGRTVRVLEFQFETPIGGDPDYRREIFDLLDQLIRYAEFAADPTRFDLVAPAKGLKLSLKSLECEDVRETGEMFAREVRNAVIFEPSGAIDG